MGRTAVTSHGKGSKHKEHLQQFMSHGTGITAYLVNEPSVSNTSTNPSPSTSQSQSMPGHVTGNSPTLMSRHVQASARLRAETLWGFHFVNQNMSFRSNTDVGYVFRNMFLDSSIANDIPMSETKSMYTVVYGIAPYLQSLLEKHIKLETDNVSLFDESLNKDLLSKQMDALVWCWDDGKVSSRYYKSKFFGHGTAVDLNNIMQDHVEVNPHGIQQYLTNIHGWA